MRRTAILRDDHSGIVDVVLGGDCAAMGAMEIPDSLDQEAGHLAFDGTKIKPLKDFKSLYVDEGGNKRVTNAPKAQKVDNLGDEEAIKGKDGKWRKKNAKDILAPDIKAECGRRINAVMDATTQANFTAEIAVLGAKTGKTAAEKTRLATAISGVEWTSAMRAKCRELVEAGDKSYAKDNNWPTVPAGVVDLANEL